MISDIAERLARYRAFYAVPEPALLVHIRCPSRREPSRPVKPYYLKRLPEFDFHDRRDRQRWFQEIVDEVFEENCLHVVADDYLPSIKVLLGQLHSLVFRDRPIRHSAHSSWVQPCLSSLEEADGLSVSLDSGNFWWELYTEAKRYAAHAIGTEGFLATMHSPGPLDLAYDLRGDALYTDLYDDPEGVQRLLAVCTDTFLRMADGQRAIEPEATGCPPRTDGTFWVPGWGYNVMIPGAGCHFSADIGCQLSPAIFEAAELPWIRRIIAARPGCLLHSHSVATHQQPLYAGLAGLEMIQIVADPNVPHPVEDIDAVLGRVGLKPVLLTASAALIRANIARLARGRVVLRTDAATEEEAREILSLVRLHSRKLS